MSKYILKEKLYDTKKMKLLVSTITGNVYKSNDNNFIEEETFWGIPLGNARIVSESFAKSQVGSYGNWKTYEEVWGYVPED